MENLVNDTSHIEKEELFKKGDRVLVWSMQSFFYGGFLNGEPAFLRQSQHGEKGSLILSVIRNFGGDYKIDECYEVYKEQVKEVSKKDWSATKELKKFRKEIIANNTIW